MRLRQVCFGVFNICYDLPYILEWSVFINAACEQKEYVFFSYRFIKSSCCSNFLSKSLLIFVLLTINC